MTDKYRELAEYIISNVGGAANIAALTHCLTRLRLKLTDKDRADITKLEEREEIIAVRIAGGWHQIVIGTYVSQVCLAVGECISAATAIPAAIEIPAANNDSKKRADYTRNPSRKEDLVNGAQTAAAAEPPGIYRIGAPCEGLLVQLAQIEDETFASGVLGIGVAIEPGQGKIYAPCDGTITTFFPTGHAIGITSPQGTEILIHVGRDTVHMNGSGFYPRAEQNDTVKQGDLLLEFDIEKIKQAGYSAVTPVIVTNTESYLDTVTAENGQVQPGDVIITLLTG